VSAAGEAQLLLVDSGADVRGFRCLSCPDAVPRAELWIKPRTPSVFYFAVRCPSCQRCSVVPLGDVERAP
jgi:hypothetical protein